MEFDKSLRENPSFHPNLFPENPVKTQFGTIFPMAESLASKEQYQSFPNSNQFSIQASSKVSILRTPALFFDPFDPFQTSVASVDSKNLTLCTPNLFKIEFDGANEASMHDFQSRGHENFFPKALFPEMDQPKIHKPLSFLELGTLKPNLTNKGSCAAPETENELQKKADTDRKKTAENKRRRTFQENPDIVKGQWTRDEDRILRKLVNEYGESKWSQIAQKLHGRVGKQCRERWHNHLRPDIIKKEKWSEEEDRTLIEAHRLMGNRWAEMAKRLPGRSENTIKNHWNATLRKQIASMKSPNSKINNTLENYIQTIITSPANHKNTSHSDSSSQVVDTNAMINQQCQLPENSSFGPKDQAVISAENDEAINFFSGAKGFSEGYKFAGMPYVPNVGDNNLGFEAALGFDAHLQFDERKEMDFLHVLTGGIF